jgi:FixJ family two-component response regulator
MRHGAADYLVMPGMSGPQLAALLTGGERPMKELYMSGYLDDAVIRHGINETGLVFLHKPLTPDSLLRKVREVLDEEMPAAEEADGGVV